MLQILKEYSLWNIIRESWRSLIGYYTDWNKLVKRLGDTQWILGILIPNILMCYLLLELYSSSIGSSVSSHSVSSTWKSLNIVKIFLGDYKSFVDDTHVTQPILFNFAIYVFFNNLLSLTIIAIYLVYIFKGFLSYVILSHIETQKYSYLKATDIIFNPFPLATYLKLKKMNMPNHERSINFQELFNKFLDLQAFPDITNNRALVKVSNLSFMYHGDNSWDKYLHVFLQKYFPNLYHKHILSNNTRNKEEELEKTQLKALKNINLSIHNSTFTTILGCNGSSKSTLIKAIINLFEKYAGEITWITKDLKDISHKSFYRNVAYVAQENLIQSKITVYDYVACGLFPSFSFFKFSYPKDHPLILKNLEKMGIMHHKDKYLAELSGGEKQKAILARVLTQETKVIILDEPTTYLDISNQYLILNLLKQLQKEENKTIITILHDIKQAEQFSDEIILLNEGEVYAYGKTKDIITKNNIEKVFEISWY